MMSELQIVALIVFVLWTISLVGSIVRTWYVGLWDGTNQSARFRKGGLWLGCNERTKKWFIIFNGKISWQVQNWQPKLAIWKRK